MAEFDISSDSIQKARSSGYTDDEIFSHLSTQYPDKFGAAQKAGYSSKEVLEHIAPTTVSGDLAKTVPTIPAKMGKTLVTAPFDLGEMATHGAQWLAKNIDPGMAMAAENPFAQPTPSVETGVGKAVAGALEPARKFFESQGSEATGKRWEREARAEAEAKGVPYEAPYQPQTTPVKMGMGALDFLAAAPSTGGLKNVAGVVRALTGGAVSEGAGELAKKYLPAWAEVPARLFGGGVGSAVPAGARRTIGPGPTKDTALEGAGKTLEAAGVPLTPYRATGGRGKFESTIGQPSWGTPQGEAQAIEAAAMRHIGSTHPSVNTPVTATGEAIQSGQVPAGHRINALGHRGDELKANYSTFFNATPVTYNPAALQASLDPLVNTFERSITRGKVPPTVREIRDEMVHGISGKPSPSGAVVQSMTGDRYMALKDSLDKALAGASGREAQTLLAMRGVLDNTFKNSLPPGRLAELNQLNDQYGNFKIARDAVVKGKITPESLGRSAKQNVGDTYATGGGPSLARVAASGEEVLGKRPPGRSQKLVSAGLGGLSGFVPNMIGGGIHWDPTTAIFGGMAAEGGSNTANSILRSLYYPANRALSHPGVESALAIPSKQDLIKSLSQAGITLPPGQPPQKQ